MPAETFEKISTGIFHIVATLGLIAAGTWALIEYYDNKRINRVKVTQQYISSISSGDVKNSQKFLIEYWSKFDWEANKEKDKNEAIINIVSKNIEYQIHLKNILLFLEDIQNCAVQDICDINMIKKNFRPLFVNGFANHFAWIKHHREKSQHATYYLELECFVRNNIKELEGKSTC